MARTINFVRERRRTLGRQEQTDREVLRYVTFGLFGLGVAILLVIGARLFLLYQIKTVQAEQKTVQEQIAQKEGIEEKYTIFANKLKVLTELFGKRKEKQEALEYFSGLFGSDVIISQLSYTADKEVLSFVLEAKSIFSMEEVFNIINSDQVKQKYPDIQKNSLRRGSDGSYGMQVTLVFGDKPIEEKIQAAEEAAQADQTDQTDGTQTETPTDTTQTDTTQETPADTTQTDTTQTESGT
ncbi:MAG: hypothetical protein COY81_05290 [Candidatus Pacebacteria bacterium CG_4_10_14_0_8_um_filter_43_12]|nr:MAG: hypothetical protein COY81_05290 [Candidatus Pacebacteria bacterium CG_4_10_14_0_8_um_filter_43_12]